MRHSGEELVGILSVLGIFSGAAIMSLGWVLCLVPGMCQVATRLIRGGAGIATFTMLGLAVSGAALGIDGMTWMQAGWLLIVAGACFAFAKLANCGKSLE